MVGVGDGIAQRKYQNFWKEGAFKDFIRWPFHIAARCVAYLMLA